MTRPLLPATHVTDRAQDTMGRFHASIIDEVQGLVATRDVVVVGMAWNSSCTRARRLLTEARMPPHYVEYENYITGWRRRLALKMWTGWPTFPQVFVKGVLVGGADDVAAMLQDGSLRALFDAPRRS